MKSDSVVIKNSPISGKGLFATKNYKKGEIVLHWDTSNLISKEDFEKKSDKEKTNIFFMNGKFGIMADPEKYANHSCNANTTTKGFSDVAIRDILAGEEITVDYSISIPHGVILECNCGSKNCKKKIIRQNI